jgi:hypothetical protein
MHERERWLRPDAHRFIRPDWRRYVDPGSELAAYYESIEQKYRPDQARVPAGDPAGGQWTADGEGGSGNAPADAPERIRTAGSVIPICIVGSKAVFGDGTHKVVYICADGREITRVGAGRILGVILQPR